MAKSWKDGMKQGKGEGIYRVEDKSDAHLYRWRGRTQAAKGVRTVGNEG